jgi:hypothetical protein
MLEEQSPDLSFGVSIISTTQNGFDYMPRLCCVLGFADQQFSPDGTSFCLGTGVGVTLSVYRKRGVAVVTSCAN